MVDKAKDACQSAKESCQEVQNTLLNIYQIHLETLIELDSSIIQFFQGNLTICSTNFNQPWSNQQMVDQQNNSNCIHKDSTHKDVYEAICLYSCHGPSSLFILPLLVIYVFYSCRLVGRLRPRPKVLLTLSKMQLGSTNKADGFID